MSLTCFELDSVIRSHTGVRGYLDFQDAMNARVREGFKPLMAPAENNLDAFLAALLDAGKFGVAAELTVRESDRLVSLGRAPEEQRLSGPNVPHNAQAIRFAERATSLLKRTQESLDDAPLNHLRDVHQDRELPQAFDEAREALAQHLVKYNIKTEDLGEVFQMWDENVRVATESGVRGLLDGIAENLRQFIEVRREDDRGTRPHSPLPWWKYVIIAAIIGAAIFAIIACFVWSACVWVWPAVAIAAPWVFGIIDRGC